MSHHVKPLEELARQKDEYRLYVVKTLTSSMKDMSTLVAEALVYDTLAAWLDDACKEVKKNLLEQAELLTTQSQSHV